MDNQEENFDQLRQMLRLKRHEVPPPGYFNRLPGEIISRIQAEDTSHVGAMDRLESEAPWLMRLWRALEAKPLFGGAFGAAVCALVLGAIYLTEKPADKPAQPAAIAPFAATSLNPGASSSMDTPLLLAATNLSDTTGPNLFDLVQPLQTAPVSHSPGQ